MYDPLLQTKITNHQHYSWTSLQSVRTVQYTASKSIRIKNAARMSRKFYPGIHATSQTNSFIPSRRIYHFIPFQLLTTFATLTYRAQNRHIPGTHIKIRKKMQMRVITDH